MPVKMFFSLLLCAAASVSFAQPLARSSVAFTSSDLPIVVINTHGKTIVDEPKIPADMGIISNGEGRRNVLTDPFNNYNGKIGIEIRGSSSQQFPKKQYGFTTFDAAGADNDVSLLGFPSEHTWVLSAPYTDKTFMRDAITYILSNRTGRYASRTRFCEVFVDEGKGPDYKGIYLLMEKIKRDKNRVNISKMTTADTTGDNVTGGYIYKIDKADKATDTGWDAFYPPFATSARRFLMYQYHYPDPEDIMPQQAAYLQAYDRKFETMMMSASYRDAAVGYPAYIDVKSFADMVCFNELSKNVDGYRLSTYLYKDRTSRSDKLFAGPYWDYNLGYGNCDYADAWITSGFEIDMQSNSSGDAFAPPFWWKKLWADPAFKKVTADRWKALRGAQFSTANLLGLIDSLAAVVAESQQRNYERWPILGVYVWPNKYFTGTSYSDEVSWMKAWIVRRVEWLDKTFAPLGTAVHETGDRVPLINRLEPNYPNPFNPSTTIRYATSERRLVKVGVYDVLGRMTASLVNDVQPAGTYAVEWNAAEVPSGVYFCRMTAGAYVSTVTMVLAK